MVISLRGGGREEGEGRRKDRGGGGKGGGEGRGDERKGEDRRRE